VSAGIAEALVATAAGLFVAIPAVMAYNYFLGRVKLFVTAMDNAGSELVDRLLDRASRQEG
ncbi:MAG: MotA/TolQ/ExbB proton channel family protein, partial [Candidatus Methylomirabilaceae bacterium]